MRSWPPCVRSFNRIERLTDVRCRQCGAEIADKALICYRCGTATTEAKFKAPAAAGRRRSRRTLGYIIAVVLLVLLAILLLLARSGLTQ